MDRTRAVPDSTRSYRSPPARPHSPALSTVGRCDVYRCQDGYVYVSSVTSSAWRALAKLIGHPDLADATDLRTDEQRFDQRSRIDPLVAQWIAPRTTAEVVCALDRVRIPCGVYRTPAHVADDPQVRARRMLEYVDLETPGLKPVPIGGISV